MNVLAGVLVVAGATVPAPVNFPSAAEARDPSGRYAVMRSAPGARELSLRTLAGGPSRRLVGFERGASVFWSPDGAALAITVRGGAAGDTVFLILPGKPGETNLATVLAHDLGPLPEQTGNRTVRLEVVRWLDARRLRVRLRGFGTRDPQGFDELFDFELGGRFRRPVF
jgi:hypothetical protein